MQITYISHSGFLVETQTCYYIFDYYKGVLPDLDPLKPVLVFASHAHGDHYNPEIFKILSSMGMQSVTAVLSKDIPENKYPDQVPCIKVTFHQTYNLPYDTQTETLLSTDEGVAFLIRCPEGTLYHAGDLNDWVWDDESDAYNEQMTADYRTQIGLLSEKLERRALDTAFVVLDPRQEKDYDRGICYSLQNIVIAYDEIVAVQEGFSRCLHNLDVVSMVFGFYKKGFE
jgi:hypothetical protein